MLQYNVEFSRGEYQDYHTRINMYLNIQLNSRNNCINVEITDSSQEGNSTTKTYKIGTASLADHPNKEVMCAEQKTLFKALISKLEEGDPINNSDPLFIYKIHALYKKAIDTIFWINGKEKEHRDNLSYALQKHMELHFGNIKNPDLRLSESANQQSIVCGNPPNPQFKISLDAAFINFDNFGGDLDIETHTPQIDRQKNHSFLRPHSQKKLSPKLKVEENPSSSQKSRRISLNLTEKSIAEENIITTDEYKKIFANLSSPGLELCRYVWNRIYSLSVPVTLVKKGNNKGEDLKSKISTFLREDNKVKELKSEISALEFETIQEQELLLKPKMTLLIQEQICRMLTMKPFSENTKELVADIDRLIKNIEVQSDEKNILKSDVGPANNERLTVLEQIERFKKLLKFLLNKLKNNGQTIKLTGYERVNKNDEIRKISKKWDTIESQEIQSSTPETFTSICNKFLKYLIPSKRKSRNPLSTLSIKEKLASLILLINQEMYTLPAKAVLECMPPASMRMKKDAMIKLNFHKNGGVEVNATATIIPAEDSLIGNFEIIINNQSHSYISDLQSWNSNMSININDIKEKRKLNDIPLENSAPLENGAPIFVPKTLRIIGFDFQHE